MLVLSTLSRTSLYKYFSSWASDNLIADSDFQIHTLYIESEPLVPRILSPILKRRGKLVAVYNKRILKIKFSLIFYFWLCKLKATSIVLSGILWKFCLPKQILTEHLPCARHCVLSGAVNIYLPKQWRLHLPHTWYHIRCSGVLEKCRKNTP